MKNGLYNQLSRPIGNSPKLHALSTCQKTNVLEFQTPGPIAAIPSRMTTKDGEVAPPSKQSLEPPRARLFSFPDNPPSILRLIGLFALSSGCQLRYYYARVILDFALFLSDWG
jgi:hypothetical protein